MRMVVRLKKKPSALRPPALSESLERALLAILMYFPPPESRELASDLMRGIVPVTPENIRKIIEAIKDYGDKRLEFADPGFHVFRARDALKAYIGSSRPARAKRVVGRMAKCR